MNIPIIKTKTVVRVNTEDQINIFYGFDKDISDYHDSDKADAISLIEKEMINHTSFNLKYDFRVSTRIESRSWSLCDYNYNIMMYENHEAKDGNRLLENGSGHYECILWVSINKN